VDVLRRYGIREAVADRYAAEWVVSAFAEPGRDITITPADKSKSELYLEAEVLFARGNIDIPVDRTLLHELRNLERRTHRRARDSIDHPINGKDDFASACCGAAVIAASQEEGAARIGRNMLASEDDERHGRVHQVDNQLARQGDRSDCSPHMSLVFPLTAIAGSS
jgi:hypothetical protein